MDVETEYSCQHTKRVRVDLDELAEWVDTHTNAVCECGKGRSVQHKIKPLVA